MSIQRNGLTERQHEVLAVYIDAGTSKAAAAVLGLADSTVKNLLYDARHAVGAKNTVQLVYMLATGELDHLDVEDDDVIESVETQQTGGAA